MKTFMFTLFVVQAAFAQTPQRLTVRIDGVRETVGQLMVFLFANEEDYPTKRERAFKTKKVPASSSSLCVDIDDVPAGTYGIAVYHDENSNDKMDRSWYGMPKEGYGASNDATGTFGPPKFKDAKFEFKSSHDTVNIIIHY